MRSDLPKVLCERERRHRGKVKATPKNYARRFRTRPGYDDDAEHVAEDAPRKLSMTRHLGWEKRDFSENLSALKGLVRKNIGRPWAKFYSELSATFPNTSATLLHIYQHIYNYIAVDCKLNAQGVVCVHSPASRGYRRDNHDALESVHDSWHGYIAYVDPRDDIIKPVKPTKKAKRPSPEDALYAQGIVRVPGESFIFRRLRGNWFRVELRQQAYKLRPSMPGAFGYTRMDRVPVYRDILADARPFVHYGAENLVAISKQSASKAEVKAYRLHRE